MLNPSLPILNWIENQLYPRRDRVRITLKEYWDGVYIMKVDDRTLKAATQGTLVYLVYN